MICVLSNPFYLKRSFKASLHKAIFPLTNFLFSYERCSLKSNKWTFQPEQSVVSSDLHSKETNRDLTALAVQPAEGIRAPQRMLGSHSDVMFQSRVWTSNGGCDIVIVIQSLAWLALRGRSFLAAEVLFPDPLERSTKFIYAESVNDGVDSRVAMREQNGYINEEHGLLILRTEERDAVHNVEGEPANSEQEKD